ncbi:MAG: discoidin domain-containing protein, partial [Bacteroidota bacterium]
SCGGATQLRAQFDPHAGLITSYTETATLQASSGGLRLPLAVDGDEQTQWISDAPFPANYITRTDQNLFLSSFFTCTNSTGVGCATITDTDLSASQNIVTNGGTAFLAFDFGMDIDFAHFSIKGQYSGTVNVVGIQADGSTFTIADLDASNDFALLRFAVLPATLSKIRLESTQDFKVFEVAATARNPEEYVTVDLGSIKNIGKIYTRHWSGTIGGRASAEHIKMWWSNDNTTWTHLTDLVPTATPVIVTDISEQSLSARYLKITYELAPIDYNKVYLWEIDIFDECGKYGCLPAAQASTVTIAELLGVSGIWGWGNDRYSDLLDAGQGPALYDHICTHYRNYHYLSWDITDPNVVPDYTTMAAGGGTDTYWWLNWDREYQTWIDENMPIQASIQMYQSYIGQFRDTTWVNDTIPISDPAWANANWTNNTLLSTAWQSAYDYGYRFAAHFGPTTGNGMVQMLEVGNEPWVYDPQVYKTILDGMAKGAKAADPALKVLPCALQAAEENAERSGNFRNYMGARIDEVTLPALDGLNVHIYSYHNRPTGLIYGTHPENLNSIYHEVHSAMRWRDQNMPGKPVYVSEWGWDHDGGDPLCTHAECVSERAATAYASRGALLFQRLGVERATWYFYGDTHIDPSNLINNGTYRYSRSGLTSSKANNFSKKRTFYAFEQLTRQLGDVYFLSVEQEDDTAWMYLMGDAQGNPTHLVAWRPIDGDSTTTIPVTWNHQLGVVPTKSVKIDGLDSLGTVLALPTYAYDTMQFDIDIFPTIIEVQADYPAVSAKVFLQGAYENMTGKMQDALGMNQLLPMLEPFTALGYTHINGGGNEERNSAFAPSNSDDTITDWIVVELRDAANPNVILATRSALVQRDGDVVDMDGVDMVRFYGMTKGTYHVAIRHRNHLGIMTNTPVFLDSKGGI